VNHAPFVWGAYAIAVLGFGALVLVSLWARTRVRRDLSRHGLGRKR
jgi:heme exporter protein CcmD